VASKAAWEASEDAPVWRNGRRSGLKIRSPQGRAGSSPATGIFKDVFLFTPGEERSSPGVLHARFDDSMISPSASTPASTSAPRLWLASSSPRRSQLLQMLGVPFDRVVSTFEEPEPTSEDHGQPEQYVVRLARSKAFALDWKGREPDLENERHIVLSADTVVWHEGSILNKPRDEAQARAMLRRLCGSRHRVLTGVCLRMLSAGYSAQAHEETHVQFAPRDDEWIARYVSTGEPMDKAGAYAAQGLGALLIESIEGDFFNVVGLPLFRLSEMLQAVDVPVEGFWQGASTST
jgi:septum formation protein